MIQKQTVLILNFLTNLCDLDAQHNGEGCHLDKTLWMAVRWPIRFGLLGD